MSGFLLFVNTRKCPRREHVVTCPSTVLRGSCGIPRDSPVMKWKVAPKDKILVLKTKQRRSYV